MSAREELLAMASIRDYPGHRTPAAAEALLDQYRREILHEAADEIRAQLAGGQFRLYFADLIDPDKED